VAVTGWSRAAGERPSGQSSRCRIELGEDPDHQADHPGQQGRVLDAQFARRELGVVLPADEPTQFARQRRGLRPLQLGGEGIELPLQPLLSSDSRAVSRLSTR
jgi:hypothetical protein